MAKGFGEDLYRQMQKVRIDKDGTFRAPIKANGTDGIVFGDPPLADARPDPAEPGASAPVKAPGLLNRIRAALRG